MTNKKIADEQTEVLPPREKEKVSNLILAHPNVTRLSSIKLVIMMHVLRNSSRPIDVVGGGPENAIQKAFTRSHLFTLACGVLRNRLKRSYNQKVVDMLDWLDPVFARKFCEEELKRPVVIQTRLNIS